MNFLIVAILVDKTVEVTLVGRSGKSKLPFLKFSELLFQY